jgi:Tol biopolymer transport system component
MGEVFRARDSRLGRDVALKILPAAFAADAERLARFRREAQLLAALNHPHIAAIYGFEMAEGVHALALELVDGPTLDEHLAGASLRVAETQAIARQLVEALDAAHSQGIVHRDLKPANIKVRTDGTVKVLDFGLAKATDPEGVDSAQSPTVTAVSRTGVMLGTAAYMSPEQARGTSVDKRADVWAFGCVLFEMLTGRQAFAHETITDTLSAIISRDPDWGQLPADTPDGLRRLLRRCLERDVRRRLRDIGDARIDLEDDPAPSGSAAMTPLRGSAAWPKLASAAALGAAAGIGAFALALAPRTVDQGPVYARVVRLTNGPAREFAPAVSPDGKWVAYISDSSGTPSIWVKFIAGGEPVNLTAASNLEVSSGTGIGGLEISPDGTRIAVMARQRNTATRYSTWEIPAPLAGAPRQVLDENELGMRWSPDGRRITFIRAGAAAGDALWTADADGSNRRQIVQQQDGLHIHWPAWADDGYIYFIRAFTTVVNLDQSEIYRIHPDDGRPMAPVVEALRRAWHPQPLGGGRGLIYAANPSTAELRLWWRSADGTMVRQLASGVGEYVEPRASADARMLVASLYDLRQALVRIEARPSVTTMAAVTDGFQGDLDPVVSPAGNRMAFSSSRDGNRHIWSARLDGSDARPLTAGAAEDDRPAYSPDGREIAFASDRGGARSIWVVRAEGGAPRKVVDAVLSGGLTWTHDGRHIVYGAGAGDGPGLWKVAATGGTPQRLPTPTFASEPAGSAARDVIAYIASKRSGNVTISSVGFVDSHGNALYAALPERSAGDNFANGVLGWAPDGRRVAVVRQPATSAASIWIVDPESAQPYTLLTDLPAGPRIRGITWTPDGKALIVGKHDWTSDIVLLDRGQ